MRERGRLRERANTREREREREIKREREIESCTPANLGRPHHSLIRDREGRGAETT